MVVCFYNAMNGQTFTVGAPANIYTLTCNDSPITMTANAGTTPYSYTWTVPGSTITGNYANVTLPGTWSVTGQNLVSLATSQQTFNITQNTTAPVVAVSPTVVNLVCNVSASTFTGTSNLSPNVTTNWYQFIGATKVYVGVPQGTINLLQPGSSGIYWFESINNLTGCSSTKSVMVTSSVGVPQFSVTSPSGFKLGCSTNSVTSMQVNVVITSPMPNNPTDYFYAPPPGTLSPVFTPNPNQNNITIPGTWVVYVRDQTNLCVVSKNISVIQNTTQPNTYYIQPVQLLSCLNPTMNLTGVSNNTNTSITWTVPALPSNSVNPTPNIIVSTNSAIANSSVNLTSIGVYTVGTIDNSNLCRSTRTLQVNQDIRQPYFSIAPLSNSVITCANPNIGLVPVTSVTIATALVPTYSWTSPTATSVPGTSFNSTVAGVHTATATSVTNGCKYIASYVVLVDNTVPAADSIIGAACPVSTIAISPIYTTTVGLTFAWYGPNGAITSGTNQSTVIGNALGNYSCVITNTVNGCTKTVTCSVVCNTGISESGLLTKIRLFPNPTNGNFQIEINCNASRFLLFDIQGKLLIEKELKGKLNRIDLELSKGFYLYQVMEGNTILKKDKLIIQ